MRRRLLVRLRGLVQGVGFRPFVWRLARELEVAGQISNDAFGVRLEIEADAATLDAFLLRLHRDKPAIASIAEEQRHELPPLGETTFVIGQSLVDDTATALVLPDLALCADCAAELADPHDRRYAYPFINCTNCGPRFSIIEQLPYDRARTTMAGFTMCAACAAEYADPESRRFHAQPNACADCGPTLELWQSDGTICSRARAALRDAATALAGGQIVALKGLGGFQLLVDAADEAAVTRLRARKARPAKPLAVIGTSAMLETLVELDAEAHRALASTAAPILLLRRRASAPIAPNVAPDTATLGVMLPTTPLHLLLLGAMSRPLVATSGNLSDEPICIDNQEARARLGAIADYLLVHDRPIARHVDDSVVWQVSGTLQPWRRARGLAPLPVVTDRALPIGLAVGGQLKGCVGLSRAREVLLSQHLGDLDTLAAQAAFSSAIGDLMTLHQLAPTFIAHDLHPDYFSTVWARAEGAAARDPVRTRLGDLPLVTVQHHHAHLAACLADAQHRGRALGIIWDGSGWGGDGTVWGGELLLGDAGAVERVGHLRPFPLLGGDAAVHEPWRVALALLVTAFGERGWILADRHGLRQLVAGREPLLAAMLRGGARTPMTSSIGRLFDGFAALILGRHAATYEGQAAIALETAANTDETGAYAFSVSGAPLVIDWQPALAALLDDLEHRLAPGRMAARFHRGLVAAMLDATRAVGEEHVALSGGCFQNRLLAEGGERALRSAGCHVHLHRQVPVNDGGLALGQLIVGAARG